jgi:hypothetical protein
MTPCLTKKRVGLRTNHHELAHLSQAPEVVPCICREQGQAVPVHPVPELRRAGCGERPLIVQGGLTALELGDEWSCAAVIGKALDARDRE